MISAEALPSPLLVEQLEAVRQTAAAGPVLDLACGKGRNGLYLLKNDIPVVFAERDSTAIENLQCSLQQPSSQDKKHLAKLWQIDLEVTPQSPLQAETYGTIMVFRYLHRLLFPSIRTAILPGGLVVYETFTVHQTEFGRPRNPDFLLQPGELREQFHDWKILHSFEGIIESETGYAKQAIAQLVAEKPRGIFS